MIVLNLIENEAKQVFFKYGIPIPKGTLIADSKQTAGAVSNLKPPYMVKAQVPAGGRGKAGGIISAAIQHLRQKKPQTNFLEHK